MTVLFFVLIKFKSLVTVNNHERQLDSESNSALLNWERIKAGKKTQYRPILRKLYWKERVILGLSSDVRYISRYKHQKACATEPYWKPKHLILLHFMHEKNISMTKLDTQKKVISVACTYLHLYQFVLIIGTKEP